MTENNASYTAAAYSENKAGASPLSIPVERYADNIPMALWYHPNWILWKLEECEGKLRKVPYMTHEERAKMNDDCWYKLLTALSMYEAVPGSYTGVGYVFDGKPDSSGRVIVGIDIDAHGGELSQEAQHVIAQFRGTYIERSQSGKGVHILIKVRENELKGLTAHRRGEFEAYWSGRYFALTADIIGTPDNDEERYEVLDKTDTFLNFYRRYIAPEADAPQQSQINTVLQGAAAPAMTAAQLTDDEIIAMLRRKQRYAELYDGKIDDLSGDGSDVSAGDAALCCLLAFYTRKNAEQIDRLFRESGRMRAKWDERHAADGRTYGELTIDKAIAYCSTVYTGAAYAFEIEPEDIEDIKKEYEQMMNSVVSAAAPQAEAQAEPQNETQSGKKKEWTGWPFCNSRGAGDRRVLKNYRTLFDYLGESYRLNVISHDIERLDAEGQIKPFTNLDVLATYLVSMCAQLYMNTDKGTVIDAIEAIASENSYNPLAEYFEQSAAAYPENGGIEKLCNAIRMKGEHEATAFRRSLIRRWLIQAVYLANNTPDGKYKPAGAIVFQGAQGIGKSRLSSWLMPVPGLFLGERGLNPMNKDSMLECFSTGVLEISEYKQDARGLAAMKAVVTSGIEKLRPPYARAAHVYPRRTSIIITTNEDEFLADTTGNRRFWIVPMISIDWNALQALNPGEVWAEAQRAYKSRERYWMDAIETERLNELSREYQDMSNAAMTLLEILDFEAAPERWSLMNATEIYRYMLGSSNRESVKSTARGMKELVQKGVISAPRYKRGHGAAKFYLTPPLRDEYLTIQSEDNRRYL